MGYPTWLAGEEITAAKLNSLIIAAVKTTGEAVTSSTTLQNDDALFVSVAASATYRMEMLLLHDSATAGDLSIGWTGPTGATMNWGIVGVHINESSSSTVANVSMQSRVITETMDLGGGASTGTTALIAGTLVTSTTAGTLQLQWAQRASSATATNVRAGSHLVLTRIA